MAAADPRGLIRYALVGLALTVALLWSSYLVRGALLLIYISALVAIGLSPVVTRLERRRIRGTRPLPRWVAILEVYLLLVVVLVIVGVLVGMTKRSFPEGVDEAVDEAVDGDW